MATLSKATETSKPNTTMPFFKVSENFLSSALATMITKAILQPVDTCKTRAQSSRKLGFRVRFIDILVDALKKENPVALFRGLPAAWLGSIPAQSLYISTYESCKYLFLEKTHFLPKNMGIALSAAIGDSVAGFIRVPPETIKQRLQAGLDPSTSKAISHIFQTQGLKGFYRGYIAQVSRDIPYAIVLFLTYENAKLLFSNKRRMKARDNLIRGALAGGVASFLTTPLDVVKTRIMTHSGDVAVSSFRFWLGTVHRLVREEGWRSLWRGAGPRVSYKICSSALFFVCFEFLRSTIHFHHNDLRK
ncbi:hypothetical protein GpartN1_g2898.t1 [Galdieria partita]|uniref:Mitochondrial carrier protein n=1 Tax=Galdieria partita TaxID=83374 RepID=A0A9C7UQ20_9RHOD|nr:hypothetical protein GpartN1_g2898.t1 [Galdieria partita]